MNLLNTFWAVPLAELAVLLPIALGFFLLARRMGCSLLPSWPSLRAVATALSLMAATVLWALCPTPGLPSGAALAGLYLVLYFGAAVLAGLYDSWTAAGRKLPRLSVWIVITVWLLGGVLLLAPHQVPVALFKLCLVTMAGLVGYWLDRSLFPYARPDKLEGFTDDFGIITASAMLRRALIVGAAMLAIGLGA